MTNFVAAFQNGQEAAENADRARKEISDVFDAINEQLYEPTLGKIELCREEYKKEPDRGPYGIGMIFPIGPQEFYLAVAARNPKAKDKTPRKLALWSESRAGYPCKLTWGNVENSCNDRESLEACLATLLSDPIVGEKIRSIIRLPEEESKGEGTITPPSQ